MPEEFSTVFNRFFPHFPIEETPDWPYGWGMTMEDKDKELLVRLELPGFEPAEVNVEVMPERLTVMAEHKELAEKDNEKTERAYAHVKRVVTLPPDVDPEKAEALYRNGILEIRLPRKPDAVGRRLEVKK
jgi:HSP20 family protein